MMPSPILSCLLVLIHAVSFQALTVPMPKSGGFAVGDVLTSLYGPATSPFSDESQKAFEERFKEMKGAGDVISDGEFNMITKVVASQEKKLDAMDISASLSVSYMSCSADAHMEMARKSVNSELDVSVIVRAVADGRNLRMSVSDINLLEMAENHVEKETPEAFTETYGTYLVIGYEYGGEILFESTKTAKTASDKESIEAGIRLSLEKGGIKAEGGIDVSASKEDIRKSVDSHVEISIRPNSAETPLESLMEELEKLANGTSSESGFEDTLTLAAQEILSGTLDPINAIVIPLLTVGSVHDVYKADPNSAGTPAFVRHCNEIYQEVRGLQKQLKVVKKQWEKAATPELPLPTDLLLEWKDALDKFYRELDNLNTAQKLLEKSDEFGDPNSFTDVMTATTFLDITAAGMHNQFEIAIMDDYRKLFPETEPPTFSPTFSPTDTPKPTFARYVGVNDKEVSWPSAVGWCETLFDVPYPLATIRNQADLGEVQKACSGGDCWVGLRNTKYKDAFAPFGINLVEKIKDAWRKDGRWDETGTNSPQVDFWSQGEPNNGDAIFPGTGTEGCAAFWAGGLKDSNCNKENRFVCGPRPYDFCEETRYDGAWYSPLDLPGHGRTEETEEGCRQRCMNLPECYFFSNFPNGGCHLSGRNAKVDYNHIKGNPTRAAGKVRCEVASAAAVSALEQRDDPVLPALIASAAAVSASELQDDQPTTKLTAVSSHMIVAGQQDNTHWKGLITSVCNPDSASTSPYPNSARDLFGDYDIAVRCCALDGSDQYSPDCKAYPKTYEEAVALCDEYGYRLCTMEEELVFHQKGCGFDHAWLWTSTECTTTDSDSLSVTEDSDDDSDDDNSDSISVTADSDDTDDSDDDDSNETGSHMIVAGQQDNTHWKGRRTSVCNPDSASTSPYPNSARDLFGDFDIAVRCCALDGSDQYSPDCNAYPKTYEEAVQLCEDYDYRLCTLEEELVFHQKGCGFDHVWLWTSTECTITDEPTGQPTIPALIARHSAHVVTDHLDGVSDGNYCCQARTVDNWNGNWNGVCWGELTEADCNSNGRKCEWTPDDCRSELDCLLRDVECESDEDCCSGRCKVDDKLCR